MAPGVSCWGEGEGCNPSASHGEGLAFLEETSWSTGCLKEGLLRGANLKQNGFLIHNFPDLSSGLPRWTWGEGALDLLFLFSLWPH